MHGVELQLKYYNVMRWLTANREDMARITATDIVFDFPEVEMNVDEILSKASEVIRSKPEFIIKAENPQDFFGYTTDDYLWKFISKEEIII